MDRYTTEIIANEMQMLGGRNGDAAYAPQGMQQQSTQTTYPAPQPPQQVMQQQAYGSPAQHVAQQSPQGAPQPAPAMDNFDDDIPF